MSKTVELKVARRVRGFEGRAKAAEENAARLYEQVKALASSVEGLNKSLAAQAVIAAEQAGQIEALRAALTQFDQSARARLSILSARVEALETAPVPEQPEAAPAIPAGDGTAAQIE